ETASPRRRPFSVIQYEGPKKPTTVNSRTAIKPVCAVDELASRSPRIRPTRAKPARAARNPLGDVLRIPAIASFVCTAPRFVLGLMRSMRFDSFAMIGASARSLNFGSSRPCDTRICPYWAARDNRLRRSRIGVVTTSPRKKTALPRKTIARNRSMASTSEGDDLFEDGGADEHHRHADDHQQPPGVGVVQGMHVGRVDRGDRHGH